MKLKFLMLFLISIIFGCTPVEKIGDNCCSTTGPIQVYKTDIDYSKNVSVKLSEDKSDILAYPGIGSIEGQEPLELENGYLLKRMVGNAFISLTIDEYSNLTEQPTTEYLLSLVIDDNPFTEFYECCDLCLMDTTEINNLIIENRLGECDDEGWWIFN